MALQVSVGFKTAFLAAFKPTFDGGVIRLFTGAPPARADMPETGTYLGAITRNGVPESLRPYSGLEYFHNGPQVLHHPDMLFGFTAVATGEAGWARIVGPTLDDGGYSYVLPRMDCTVTAVGAGGNVTLPDTYVEAGVLITPISFFFTIPPI
jgi:hypothetical protein